MISVNEVKKKVQEHRDAEKKGWEIASYGVEHKDLGAMRNALEIIATAKIKEQTYIDVWFDGKYEETTKQDVPCGDCSKYKSPCRSLDCQYDY